MSNGSRILLFFVALAALPALANEANEEECHLEHGTLPIRGIAQVLLTQFPPVCAEAETLAEQLRPNLPLWASDPIPPTLPVYFEKYRECERLVSLECNAALKPLIPYSDLRNLFAQFKSNPYFRMRDPAVFCYERAYLLSRKLAELGYRSELLQITQSPVSLGIVRDRKGQAIGFYDYGGIEGDGRTSGQHWAVTVQMRASDGSEQTMVLDPQFADDPLSKAEYFRHVAGQDCNETEGNFWSCRYRTLPSNALPVEADLRKAFPRLNCDWPNAATHEQTILSWNESSAITYRALASPDLLPGLMMARWQLRRRELEEHLQQARRFLAYLESDQPSPFEMPDARQKARSEILNLQRGLREFPAERR